jgi:hypothetical protein
LLLASSAGSCPGWFLSVILGGTGPHMLANSWALVVLIGGATQAAVTGLVLLLLLPRSRMSGSGSLRRSSPR